MNVRAKFKATTVQQYPTAGNGERFAQVTLVAVYNDGPENETWSKATPAGQLTMTISNPAALNTFVEGRSYYLDFTPVDPA